MFATMQILHFVVYLDFEEDFLGEIELFSERDSSRHRARHHPKTQQKPDHLIRPENLNPDNRRPTAAIPQARQQARVRQWQTVEL